MKRVFSWLVLSVCVVAFYYVEYLFWALAVYIFHVIYNFSDTLFWVLVVSEATGALFVIIAATIYGGTLTVKLSQAVNASKKGARYIVIPIIVMIFSLFLLIGIPAGYVLGADILLIAGLITMIIYGISVIVCGMSKVKEQQLL